MARLLFLPMSWGRGMGPLIDCLAVAGEAVSTGCEVGFICRKRFSKLTQEAGYQVYPIVSPQSPKQLTSLFDMDFPFFQGLADEKLVRKTLDDEICAIKNFKPDAIFSWLQYTAYISAKSSGALLASVARWTGHPDFTSPLLRGGHFPISRCTSIFNKILSEYNLPKIKDIWELDFMRSDLKIIPGTPELEPKLQRVPNTHYVGYLSAGETAFKLKQQIIDWMADHPTVFVYLSAKQFLPSRYIPVIKEAYEDSEFRVLVAVGLEDVCKTLPRNTKNVRFERLVPTDKVMPKSDVVISTGTRGLSWQAALYGASLLAFPGSDPERYFVSGMVERAGAGLRLSDNEFTPARIREATHKVLGKKFRESASEFGKRLRSLGGPRKTAELLVKLAKKK